MLKIRGWVDVVAVMGSVCVGVVVESVCETSGYRGSEGTSEVVGCVYGGCEVVV